MTDRVTEALRLRARGLTYREISERMGVGYKRAWEMIDDPDGAKARARKAKNNGVCKDCGGETKNGGALVVPERCLPCAGRHKQKMSRAWIVESMQEWHRLFGRPPAASDWNPKAAKWNIQRRIDRLEATGRPWPGVALVQYNYGSWAAGLRAAGFEPVARNETWIGREGLQLREQDRTTA